METSKKAPAFQFYPQDFISSLDVQLMSAAEVGAYCLLLFNSWMQTRQGYLPNDEAQLRYLSRLSTEEWKSSKKRLLSKFPVTPDKKYRYNPRLAAEADKQSDFRTKQAENGKRGGRPKKADKPPKPDASEDETQNNPGLSSGLILNNPEKALPSSTFHLPSSSSISSSKEKKIESESACEEAVVSSPPSSQELERLPAEDPVASASHTEGARPIAAYNPDDFSPALVLPFPTDTFRRSWAKWRRYHAEELKRPLGGGMREQEALRKLGGLAGKSEPLALAIIDQAISKGWKDVFPLDSSSPAFVSKSTPAPTHATATSNPIRPLGGQKPTAGAGQLARALAERRTGQ